MIPFNIVPQTFPGYGRKTKNLNFVIIQCTKKKIFYKSFHIMNPVKNNRVDANIFYNAIFYSIHPIKNPTIKVPIETICQNCILFFISRTLSFVFLFTLLMSSLKFFFAMKVFCLSSATWFKASYHAINTSHQDTWRNVWVWFKNIWTTSEVASVQVLLQGYCRDRWPQIIFKNGQVWEFKSVNELRHMWKDMKEGQWWPSFFCVTEHLQKTLSLLNPNCWLPVSCLLATHRNFQVFIENLFL